MEAKYSAGTVKLTKRSIDALRAPREGYQYAWDTERKGFGLRLLPSGKKVFVLKYRPLGNRATRFLTLGIYGNITVEQARTMATKRLGEIASGADPARVNRDKSNAPTVAKLGEGFLEHVDTYRKTTTAREYKRLWKKHVLPAIGARKVTDVQTSDVTRLHRALKETPYIANRVLALIGAFFTYAASEGERPSNDLPSRDAKPFAEKARERFLTDVELGRLGDALRKAEHEGLRPAPNKRRKDEPKDGKEKHRAKEWDKPIPADPIAINAIRLLLLTGCRRNEVLSLRWDAVDFERGFLRFEDTKTGRSERVLSASAKLLLASLPRLEGSPFVFPGFDPAIHLATITRIWYAVRHEAELTDVRLHDMRHTFGGFAAEGSRSLLVTAKLLGHRNTKTTQRYAHLTDDPVRLAADQASGEIAALVGPSVKPSRAAG